MLIATNLHSLEPDACVGLNHYDVITALKGAGVTFEIDSSIKVGAQCSSGDVTNQVESVNPGVVSTITMLQRASKY